MKKKKKKKKKHATKKEVQNIIKKDITMRHLNELRSFSKEVQQVEIAFVQIFAAKPNAAGSAVTQEKQ